MTMRETTHEISLSEDQERKLQALAHFFNKDPYVFIVTAIDEVCEAAVMFEMEDMSDAVEDFHKVDFDEVSAAIANDWSPLPPADSHPHITYLVPLTDRQKELIDLSRFDYPGESLSIAQKAQLSVISILDRYIENYPEAYPSSAA